MPFGSNFSPDKGPRGGSPNPDASSGLSTANRGSFGSEQNPTKTADLSGMLSSSLPNNPHSARGFRKALMKTQRTSGSLKDQLPNKQTFGSSKGGFAKPNYFAQGGGRHGMHVGSGAPVVRPADSTGADVGDE